jgi:hypothetical protein
MDNTQLTLNDLDNLRAVIDIACQRGAFRAGEMKDVGELYLKLKNFIEQMASVQEQDQPETPSAPPQGE